MFVLLLMFSLYFIILMNIFLLKFNIESMEPVYNFAKSQYECGNYLAATEYLYLYRLLVCIN